MTRIMLPEKVDLAAVVTLADTLRAAGGAAVIDGSAVERIGVAGLQLLLSARATAAGAGRSLVVEQPSRAFVAAARTAGADGLFAPGSAS